MITQRVQALGNFQGQLNPTAADSVVQFVTEGSEIVITPSRIDVASYSDANIQSAALYLAYITNKVDNQLQGYDLSMFLGTSSGLGDLLDAVINAAGTAWTLAQWVTALLPASLTSGTIRVGGATFTGPPGGYRFISRREALTAVCAALTAEWRVNPNGTLDADTVSVLYPTATTPTVVITKHDESQDGTFRGLQGTLMQSGVDLEEYTTSAIVVAQGSGSTVITAVANSGATTYKDHLGNNLVMERFVDAPSDNATTAATTASTELAKSSSARRQLSVRSTGFAPTQFAKPGDSIYAFDLSANLVDSANQITYRGELLPVIKLRVFGITWPVQRGMGVYCRKWVAGVATYLDLSDQWDYEDGETTWDVGQVPMIYSSAAAPQNGTSGGNTFAGPARLGVHPDIARRMADPSAGIGAGAPAGTGNRGEWYEDTTNDRTYRSDGAGWIIMYEPPQTNITPATWMAGGVTIGNGTCLMAYQRHNGRISFEFLFTFGTTSAVTGAVTFTLPKAGVVNVGQLNIALIGAAGGAGQLGINAAGTTTVQLLAHNAAGTYLDFAVLGAGIPFVWTGGTQTIGVAGDYRMSSLYS